MPDRRVDGPVLPSRLARYLLPALFAILTAAIGGVTWRFYTSQKELTERGAQSQLLTVADTKVREISAWRKGRLGEARAIMADTFTVAAFERVIEGAFRDHAAAMEAATSGLSAAERGAAVALLKKLGLSARER